MSRGYSRSWPEVGILYAAGVAGRVMWLKDGEKRVEMGRSLWSFVITWDATGVRSSVMGRMVEPFGPRDRFLNVAVDFC